MSYRQLNDGLIQTMRELRANGWSLEGIARVYHEYGVTANTVEFLLREGAAEAVVSRAADLVMDDLAREASDAIERVAPYDLTAAPTAYAFLQPGWGDRLKELAPRATE